MSNQKHYGSNAGKGYYIALILCAVAIGISGYLYYRNANQTEPALDHPGATQGVEADPVQKDLPVVAPQPQPGDQAQVPEKPESTKTMKTTSPVDGETITEYAMDCLSYNQTTRDWRTHNGVDIGAEEGAEVLAAADGTVYTVYEDDTMGMTVVIRHQGEYTTKYCSLAEEVLVAPGETVTMGQPIGHVGQTALLETAIGPHVHFSVSCKDESMDPAEFLNLK